MKLPNNNPNNKNILDILKRSTLYIFSILFLFIIIGIFTTISPALRLSSNTLTNWTNEIESSTFMYLLGMENRAFMEGLPPDASIPNVSSTIFQIATSIKPDDPRSLLGNELPGFSIFDSEIFIAGEGTNYTNLPVESSPPLEEVLKDREAIVDEELEISEPEEPIDTPSTGDKKVVFIYNTHNYESFLPHLPGVTDPNLAQHSKVNISKVSERFSNALDKYGIGNILDKTDTMKILDENNMEYWQSYEAIRGPVQEAFKSNKDVQYVFDFHRDGVRRDVTTKVINGESYAKIAFVIGGENKDYEKNLEIASKLWKIMEEKYPGLSRGVLPPKKGVGTNGLFNQDLHENALTVEIGGVDNTLDELYRSADILAEVFSEYYWDAEKVSTE
ncbi:stage II sporulation protein P [Ornithinibacillus halotolerans]|uniref:Stage II sporulation protein P n=1 Tax=Ornithinibacillus halotolerans TaxID=1274357 RepID=A0A916RVV4_9BACI|nr:stage II sporulation protein P [Ornithinibacillus halotolerans]GGA68797.1 stage II sporulation protein P [Ornithinibacillus halotolerans]